MRLRKVVKKGIFIYLMGSKQATKQVACLMRLKSAKIAGFHEYSAPNSSMAISIFHLMRVIPMHMLVHTLLV